MRAPQRPEIRIFFPRGKTSYLDTVVGRGLNSVN